MISFTVYKAKGPPKSHLKPISHIGLPTPTFWSYSRAVLLTHSYISTAKVTPIFNLRKIEKDQSYQIIFHQIIFICAYPGNNVNEDN